VDVVVGIMLWGHVNPVRVTNAPSLAGLQHRGGTPDQKQQFPTHKC